MRRSSCSFLRVFSIDSAERRPASVDGRPASLRGRGAGCEVFTMLGQRHLWATFIFLGACGSAENPEPIDATLKGDGGMGGESGNNPSGGQQGQPVSAGGSSLTGGSASGGSDTGGDGGEPLVGGSGDSDGGSSVTEEGSGGGAETGVPVEEEVASAPIARSELGVAALNDEIYVMCGFAPTVTSTMQVYNPKSDEWRDAASVPVECHHPNVGVVDGILYILGFHAGYGQRMGDGHAFAYDPKDDEWSERSPLPEGTERGASCVTTYRDKIYLFGGSSDVALEHSSVYDPTQDSWRILPPLPIQRHHCIASVFEDKIYILSGRDVVIEDVQPESYLFDPVTEEYSELAPIPTPRGGAAGGLLGDLIYVFGGEGNINDPDGIFHEVEAYNPLTDRWTSLDDMVVPRHGTAGAVIGDRLYIPLGSVSQGIEPVTTTSVFSFKAP